MVKKALLSLLMMYSFCLCHGQDGDPYIQNTIKALNMNQPVAFKKVKPRECSFIIKIHNQQEFDNLNEVITQALNNGRNNIHVQFRKGIYHLKKDHIVLKGIDKKVAITLDGKRAVITSCEVFNDADKDPWLEMVQMEDIIQVVDKEKKICLIPYPNKWDDKMRQSFSRVQVTQWFRARIYDVEKIDTNGIYFVAKELAWDNGFGHKGYNVNFDYLYLGKKPRFRLYNNSKESIPAASCFLRIENSDGVMLEMKGLTFKGCKSVQALITMNNVTARQIYIHDCVFERIHNTVGKFVNVNNVIIDHNIVKNTDGNEMRFVNNCENVRVTNNLFEHCGMAVDQTFCVTCWECSYFIADNTFKDFGYAAIGVGVWHGFEKDFFSGGIIEHNEIYFTPEYFTNAWKHMLMDSGAIYVWTQNDGTIIRYNYIHDYVGMGDNRGVFCDDGASNLKIYGNIILNTPNSYSIDSRFAKDKREGVRCNDKNFIANNIVDNRIRFMGYEKDNRHCIKGSNIILNNGGKTIYNILENLEYSEPDIVVTEFSYEEGKLTVPKEYRNMVKKVKAK